MADEKSLLNMLSVVTHPHSVLSSVAEVVTVFDRDLKVLLNEMAEAMYVGNGVGLAAPQVNVSRRFIIIDPSGGEDHSQLVSLINPKVSWWSVEMELGQEGCLSLPGV